MLTALAEDGTALGQEFAEKLLNVPTISTGNVRVQEEASQKLASLYDNRRAALTVQIEERNKALLDAEIQHIEKWAEDQQLTLENELKDIKTKIKEKTFESFGECTANIDPGKGFEYSYSPAEA